MSARVPLHHAVSAGLEMWGLAADGTQLWRRVGQEWSQVLLPERRLIQLWFHFETFSNGYPYKGVRALSDTGRIWRWYEDGPNSVWVEVDGPEVDNG